VATGVSKDTPVLLSAMPILMPELPDISLYLHALRPRIDGATLTGVRLANPFLLRSTAPPIAEAAGRRVAGLSRIGKRIVVAIEPHDYLVIHLMIAGRFRWRPAGSETPEPAKIPGKVGLAAFDFSSGTLILTEAGTKRRAWLRFVRGEDALGALDPGGIDVLAASLDEFRDALTRENHTLKRTLTDPRVVDGVGNAYSDEILHRARLSPFKQTAAMTEGEMAALHAAARATLTEWIDRLTAETGDAFPEKVTAFREGMAVHGRYRQPCPVCGAPVQRIVYAENEANYCARCQTGGRLLADRALSRLLKADWPKTPEALEEMRRPPKE